MLILGIETSCDETAAAVVKDGREILSNVVASSVELHKKYGGIIPEIAAREQAKCVIPVIHESIKSLKGIDAIAVTVGPGLIGSLLIGVEAAKTLAFVLKKPVVPVNHLLAHFYASWLETRKTPQNPDSVGLAGQARKNGRERRKIPQFPLIGLVASGGHTELILMRGHGDYTWLGGTRDDAAGECFDKCARILNLGYPGGPAIEKATSTISHKSLIINHLPRPMISQDNFDFSFSGLKTAVLREVGSLKLEVGKDVRNQKLEKQCLTSNLQPRNLTSNIKPLTSNLAASIQEAITDILVEKTIRAAKKYKVKSIIISGGVAANSLLRKKFKVQNSKFKVKFFCPEKFLCTDNAAFIASCAFYNFHPVPWQKLQANPSLSL